jgi:hypothetical protein
LLCAWQNWFMPCDTLWYSQCFILKGYDTKMKTMPTVSRVFWALHRDKVLKISGIVKELLCWNYGKLLSGDLYKNVIPLSRIVIEQNDNRYSYNFGLCWFWMFTHPDQTLNSWRYRSEFWCCHPSTCSLAGGWPVLQASSCPQARKKDTALRWEDTT